MKDKKIMVSHSWLFFYFAYFNFNDVNNIKHIYWNSWNQSIHHYLNIDIHFSSSCAVPHSFYIDYKKHRRTATTTGHTPVLELPIATASYGARRFKWCRCPLRPRLPSKASSDPQERVELGDRLLRQVSFSEALSGSMELACPLHPLALQHDAWVAVNKCFDSRDKVFFFFKFRAPQQICSPRRNFQHLTRQLFDRSREHGLPPIPSNGLPIYIGAIMSTFAEQTPVLGECVLS